MGAVDAYGDPVLAHDPAPGGVHGVGGPILVVCSDDVHDLRVQQGLGAEALPHEGGMAEHAYNDDPEVTVRGSR